MQLEDVRQVSHYLRDYLLGQIETEEQHDVMLTALSILVYDILHLVSFSHGVDFKELISTFNVILLQLKEDALNAAN